MKFLSIDVGTTGCKCQLFSQTGEILEYFFEEYDFRKEGDYNYVDVDAIWSALKKMIAAVAKNHEISSFCVSSLGEACVLLDKDDNIVFYPMLYTDARGGEQAEYIEKTVGRKRAFEIAGVTPHNMFTISKILWIKDAYPEKFAKIDKALLVCDYIGYLLSGERVIDYALASRSGAFDIEKMEFSKELTEDLGVPRSWFSTPKRAGYIVGNIKKELCEELGLCGSPVLVLGSHDQVCTSIGAGILEAGDAVDGLGTVECITTLFDKKLDDFELGDMGYCCTPFGIEGLYCTYIVNYSCGSVINWFRKGIMHGYTGEKDNFFSYIESGMKEGPTGLLALPYFGGASTPYHDVNAKGAIINLTTQTTDSDVYKALMESTAMEMRLNAEVMGKYGVHIKSAVATGGGANSAKWLQLKADIQNISYKILRSSEGGLCGCAMIQAVALKSVKDYFEARDVFVRYTKEFEPNKDSTEAYEGQYNKYKKLYKTLKEMY